jgi:GT2 family glycosyltransferase
MAAPGTTVCVIPRERFSAAVPALESLLTDPDAPERVVCFDGGSPQKVRVELERLARAHDLTLLRSDAYVVPNEARNHVLPHVDTEFTAFLDNDVWVSPGWVPRLEAVARDTGAAVVAPMYGWAYDDPSDAKVHLAGAENHLSGPPGQRRHHMDFAHEGEDPAVVAAELDVMPTEQAEFHLYFARTDALAAAGRLDEGLTSLQEHLDLSLRIMDQGGKIWLEPKVFATYVMTNRLTLSDRRYFLLRWSRRWNTQSLDAFCASWGVDRADPSIVRLEQSASYKRRVAYWPYRSPIGRIKAARGLHSLPLPDHTIAPLVARYEDRRRRRAPAPRVVHLASWDRSREG